MLKITSNNQYSTPLKNSVNFGKREQNETVSYEREKTSKEIKAEKLERLAKEAKASGKPSAIKSFTIVAALMSASALTASVLAGRFFNVLNKMGALKKISKGTIVLVENLQKKVINTRVSDKNSFKGKTRNYAKQTLNYIDNLSKNGVEEKLKKLTNKKSRKMAEIKRYIQKANPNKTFTKEEMKIAIKSEILNNEKFRKELENIANTIKDAKGANLLNKTTKASFATIAGTGALTEASKDVNKNGVPDCVEYQKVQKEASQKLTAVAIDCLLDSL